MATPKQSTTAPKQRMTIQTVLLNFLGCTTKVSPVEEMTYMTTSKRLTLTNPVALNLEEPPKLVRSDSGVSKVTDRQALNKKKRSIIIESPSGFKHEFQVNSENELQELELLRTEVERRVLEAAARHAEMNTLARKKSIRDRDGNGGLSSLSSRKGTHRPSSIAPVKRKPVPSMYPYIPQPSSPGSWSTTTLSHHVSPVPPKSLPFEDFEDVEDSGESSTIPSNSSSSHLPSDHPSSTDASSVENMHIDDTPCLSSDEGDSSSLKSSSVLSTPPTSSPEMAVLDLAAPSIHSEAPPPIEKDIPISAPSELIEKDVSSRPHALIPQPSIAKIDVYLFGVNTYPENMLAFEAGQKAREARTDMRDYPRMAPQREDDQESYQESFLNLADTISN